MKKETVLKWVKKIGFVLAGAGLGYAYYHFIGCSSGTCPITRNPWISTGYGALLGVIFSWERGVSNKKQRSENN